MRGDSSIVSPPRAVVIAVGDELLFGQTTDTNGSRLAFELSALGFQVVRRWVVADLREEIQRAVEEGMALAELVLLTGGLGPTPDDLTRPAVADLFHLPLLEDPGLISAMEARYRARGLWPLQENNRRMAMVPEGAQVLPNPVGAAPGLVMENQGRMVILLPGPPMELEALFHQGVRPFLQETFGAGLAPTFHRVIHTTGIAESVLSREMESLLPDDLGPVSIAFLPDLAGVRVRLTVRGRDEAEAQRVFDEIEGPLEGLLAPYRYRTTTGELAETLGEALLERSATVAVAESCTGGLLGKRLTDRPGASRYFLGGIIAYDNAVKIRELGLSPALLASEGAVSKAVAEAMAEGVALRFGAGAGMGITGVAGPGGGTEDKPVGTVWYAATYGGDTVARREIFLGGREAIRERGAQAAMALLLRVLEGRAS